MIVNCYAPTSIVAKNKPKELDDFYKDVQDVIDIRQNKEVYLCGDFNARLGKRKLEDNSFRGSYGHGCKNESGEKLEEFLSANDLFACNPSFKHAAKRITTWNATKKIFWPHCVSWFRK